jgi:hypothetical protein
MYDLTNLRLLPPQVDYLPSMHLISDRAYIRK